MRGESENGHFDLGSILLLRLMCQQYIHILNNTFFLLASLVRRQVLKLLWYAVYIFMCVLYYHGSEVYMQNINPQGL